MNMLEKVDIFFRKIKNLKNHRNQYVSVLLF